MSLSRILGGIGRVLISAGVLILLFVAYQLWGTGLQTRAEQNRLETEFENKLAEWETQLATSVTSEPGGPVGPPVSETSTTAEATTTSADSNEDSGDSTDQPAPTDAPTTTEPTTTEAPTTTGTTIPNLPQIAEAGEAIASINIPDINLEWLIVEGVAGDDLKKGPGHYPGTPMPGQPGNAAIAGHRTTYGAPFYRVNELAAGDPIFVRTLQGQFEYRVTESLIVTPAEYNRVINEPEGDLLTLTTCHPRFSAAQRYIVHAELIGEAAPGYTDEQLAAQAAATERAGEFGAPDVLESAAEETGADTGDTVPTELDAIDDQGSADSDQETEAVPTANDDGASGAGEAGGQIDGQASAGVAGEVAAPEFDAEGFTLDENAGAWKEFDNWTPTFPWAALVASVAFATWLLGRQWKKIPAYAMGAPIFLLFLFLFFEKFSLLLPAAY